MAHGGRRVLLPQKSLVAATRNKSDARLGRLGDSRPGRLQVLDLECTGRPVGVAAAGRRLAHDQRGVLRPKEAGTIGGRAQDPKRGDADEVRQLGVVAAQFLRHQRAEAPGSWIGPCGR